MASTPGATGGGGYYQIANFGSGYVGGYAFSYTDWAAGSCTTGVGTTACNDPNALCVSGTLGVANYSPPDNCWGGGFGVNIGQAMNGAVTNITPTGTMGIKYALSGFSPTLNLSMLVSESSQKAHCAKLTVASGMVPWTTFTDDCTSAGTALPGPPSIVAIQFQMGDSACATPFTVCVTKLGFY
jgi:hypothetical protein